MIKSQIVADSIDKRGNRLTSFLVTFPRIILAEFNTHRMFSRNSSSSRAIPFNRMVKSVEENPFIPIAWQKEHKGMQGFEYFNSENGDNVHKLTEAWLKGRDSAIQVAQGLNNSKVTKQLANRLLEPFMWQTVLITSSEEGLRNFFELRCPQYYFEPEEKNFRSRKEWMKCYEDNFGSLDSIGEKDDLWWLQQNKGQAEVHIMNLAEKMYDSYNESEPMKLKDGDWHIPFADIIDFEKVELTIPITEEIRKLPDHKLVEYLYPRAKENFIKIATAMAARTSYTTIEEEKEVDYQKMIELHDRLISQDPLHASPMEHIAKVMTDYEYYNYTKRSLHSGQDSGKGLEHLGWCQNFRGFIQYRYILETGGII